MTNTQIIGVSGRCAIARCGRISALALLGVIGVVCFSGYARAGIVPNPGGSVVVTNSTTETITYIDTTVTQRVDAFSTTLRGLLNGNPVFSQTYSAPFSDPAVQAAVTQADSILSGAGASFGGPKLITNNSVLQSTVTTPPTTYGCVEALSSLPPGTTLVGIPTVTTVNTFGPNTVAVGTCSLNTFLIASGQLDVNVNTNFVYSVPRNIVTTNTFLPTQSYDSLGTGSPTSVPEPSPAALVFLGLGAAVWLRRSPFGFSRQ